MRVTLAFLLLMSLYQVGMCDEPPVKPVELLTEAFCNEDNILSCLIDTKLLQAQHITFECSDDNEKFVKLSAVKFDSQYWFGDAVTRRACAAKELSPIELCTPMIYSEIFNDPEVRKQICEPPKP